VYILSSTHRFSKELNKGQIALEKENSAEERRERGSSQQENKGRLC
jgi:hypothetical protein